MKRHTNMYILGIIIFIVLLITSNHIILYLTGVDRPVKINMLENMPVDKISFSMDKVTIFNNLMEEIQFTGWAFVDTVTDSTERYVSIILQNEVNCYEVKTHNTLREDLRKKFFNTVVQENNIGFSGKISTIEMRNGIYDVYIFCHENDNTYGISDSGLQIKKEGNNLQCYPWQSDKLDYVIYSSEFEKNESCIDYIKINDNRIDIKGWVFVREYNTELQNVYVEINNNLSNIMQYSCKKSVRNDVATVYDSNLYTNSGFFCSIPLETFDDGSYIIKILVKNDDKIWDSILYIMYKNGRSIEWENK